MSVTHFADREVRALSAGAQLTLWCARAWACQLRQREPAAPALRRGLELAGVPEALEEISAVLTLIAHGTPGPLAVGGCRCRPVTGDEAVLLDAVRAAQTGQREAAAAAFGGWLAPVAARDAALHAARFAGLLENAAMPVGLAESRTPPRPHRLH